MVTSNIMVGDKSNFFNSENTMIILRGIPGSGKSTYAKNYAAAHPNTAIVSRDNVRHNIIGDNYVDEEKYNSLITSIVSSNINHALDLGYNVVVDEMNIKNSYVKRLLSIAFNKKVDVQIVVFDIDIDSAKKNVANRVNNGGHNVPDDVIKAKYHALKSSVKNGLNVNDFFVQQATRGSATVFAPYVCKNPEMQPVYIFDIDGTLAKIREVNGSARSPYDFTRVDEDAPNVRVVELAKLLAKNFDIVIMSGRKDCSREKTAQWLADNGISFSRLLMRADDDNRDDSIVKRDLLSVVENNHGEVLGVFDDRDRVVEMWRKVGVTCFQVDYGNF